MRTIDYPTKTQEEYDQSWLERRKLRTDNKALHSSKESVKDDELSTEILNYWNSKGIIVHRKYSKRTPLILRKIIKDYSKEEILKAIDNYVTVINDNKYLFDYKWSLETFLQKPNAFPDFVDGGSKWLSYLASITIKDKPRKEQPTLIIGPNDKVIIASSDFHSIEESYLAMIDAFNRMPYGEYLQTSHWLHFKGEALKDAGFKCRTCCSKETVLNVHHNNYSNRGLETFNDVVVLCEVCHAKFHNKE